MSVPDGSAAGGDIFNDPGAFTSLQNRYVDAVNKYNQNPTPELAAEAQNLYKLIQTVSGTAGSANQQVAGIVISNPELSPEVFMSKGTGQLASGNPIPNQSIGTGPAGAGTGRPTSRAGDPNTGPGGPGTGGSGIASGIASRLTGGMGPGGAGTGPRGISQPSTPAQQSAVAGAGSFLEDGNSGGTGTIGNAPPPTPPNIPANFDPINLPSDPGFASSQPPTPRTPFNTTAVAQAPGWAGDAGLDVTDVYSGDYNPYGQGGIENLLNLYEQQNGLPAYWSDQMLPFVTQQLMLSYTNGQPQDVQSIIAGLPNVTQTGETAGTYFDPGQGWQGFLQSGGVAGLNGQPSSPDYFTSLSVDEQVAAVTQMFNVIAQGSMNPDQVASGAYMIQEYGNQFRQLRATGQLPPGVSNFIDFLRLNGADQWM